VLPLPGEHATAEDEPVRDLRSLPPLVRVKLRGHEDRVKQAEADDERHEGRRVGLHRWYHRGMI